MHYRLAAAGLLAIVAIASCSDRTPTAPVVAVDAPSAARAPRPNAPLVQSFAYTLPDGGQVVGWVQITSFSLDEENRRLLANGIITLTQTDAAGNVVRQVTNATFTGLPVRTAADVAAAPAAADAPDALVRPVALQVQTPACAILSLDLGPLFLDLLGLTINLAPVVLDVDAVPGAGNLLGNLLCAIVNLLNGPGLFAAITNLLEQLNQLLATLGGLGTAAA